MQNGTAIKSCCYQDTVWKQHDLFLCGVLDFYIKEDIYMPPLVLRRGRDFLCRFLKAWKILGSKRIIFCRLISEGWKGYQEKSFTVGVNSSAFFQQSNIEGWKARRVNMSVWTSRGNQTRNVLWQLNNRLNGIWVCNYFFWKACATASKKSREKRHSCKTAKKSEVKNSSSKNICY